MPYYGQNWPFSRPNHGSLQIMLIALNFRGLKSKPSPHRVDSPVSEHLRTERRSNPHTLFLCFSEAQRIFVTLHLALPKPYKLLNHHTLFLCFWSSKNICSPPSTTSNAVQIAQFGKGMGKIWGVWCKGAQCLMTSEFKQIKLSRLHLWSLHLCL
jgi:hypothetical protein